ncbi:MAG TPA: DEAD/DEAH box helicase [Vicinamibacterales bacterium]|nr:DEAD/DEAH box helicase [Vicinamibacterales bacterium]
MRDPLLLFHDPVQAWFRASFRQPTRPQRLGWPAIARGDSALILAPTGTGKTLAAFLACLDRLMFAAPPDRQARCRVIYVSPLKALAVDVERNLRAPLAGIANLAGMQGMPFHTPVISLRTGDTPSSDRARFLRDPGDILITTPESFYLMLTSQARERLRSVEAVIIDEIHALVSTKRGAHLALSLERLERVVEQPLQRIGLSATQRPLEEVARFLGGTSATPTFAAHAAAAGKRATKASAVEEDAADVVDHEFATPGTVHYRDVTIIDASEPKRLGVTVQVPIEDMAKVGATAGARDVDRIRSGAAAQSPGPPSIWTAIHPRLLELIQSHRSTLIFVNSRRLAERLAGALNELASQPLVRAHHGSLARAQRMEIEDLLKAGHLRGLVATSSLELGIDMGAIDLVVQIEAPPSVASGLQRIGRAGHRIEEVSSGIIFPKFRGDLVSCAAVTRAMARGEVEPSRYPRNPLDVLAQQIVAMVSVETWSVDDLFDTIRGAAPYAELSRRMFEGVLDMLSGRYPSDEFAELRPRVTWDRVNGLLAARHGARQMAIANAGTIPDRGLYGVFLLGAERDRARVGELDEEMVFEARVGETFLLGASTWRIEQITHDRVIVSPAPGEPGKMPFWRGESGGRPIELGVAIGKLIRELRHQRADAAQARLERDHGLDALAARNLLDYLDDQHRAVDTVPDDRTLLIERTKDDLGDWRVLVLSSLGSRVHAPWAMAVTGRLRDELGFDVETMWGDDGFVVRFPETDAPPDPALLLPDPDEVESLILRQLGSTALFSARFREAAARALLLPRRRPGARAPLWQQRKRAADLLSVAARFGSFPIILETYREVLRDVFDLPALVDVLRRIRSRSLRVATIESRTPSPFAASLLFNYVANYIYDGDAPLAERRAQALSVDQSQLRELIGEAELRDLLDTGAIESVEADLQLLPEKYHAKSTDGVHDLLLRIGDLTAGEIAARSQKGVARTAIPALLESRRAVEISMAGELRLVAVENAARYRDASGTPLPTGLPAALLEPSSDPLGDLVKRYARTHGPFAASDIAVRFGLPLAPVEAVLSRLTAGGRLVEGAFRPGGRGREWCDADVLRTIRRRSLARLRQEVEPVEAPVLGRFLATWHGIGRARGGLDTLLDTIEQLQGVPLVASLLEHEILPARVADYSPAQLDTLLGAGEVSWVGVEPLGDRDGRIALYLTDHLPRLVAPRDADPELTDSERDVLERLRTGGAAFFAPLHASLGGGFPKETVDALWSLVWKGLVTNDTLHALRVYLRPPERARRRARTTAFRSRRVVPSAAEGRWTAIAPPSHRSLTEWVTAFSQQLLTRHGVVTREVTSLEQIPGGFSAIYPVMRRLEETGRVRRGYFVAGLGAAQFAQPGAIDLLRAAREPADTPLVVTLAATDPANPYGAMLPWPPAAPANAASLEPGMSSAAGADKPGATMRASRSAGARVVLVDGQLTAWLARGDRAMLIALPPDDPDRGRVGRALAHELVSLAHRAPEGSRGWLIEEINGAPAAQNPAAAFLLEAGFAATAMGLQLRVTRGDKSQR